MVNNVLLVVYFLGKVVIMTNMSAGIPVAMMGGVHMPDDNIKSTWERGRRKGGRVVRNGDRWERGGGIAVLFSCLSSSLCD
jgi:hypothetical protein